MNEKHKLKCHELIDSAAANLKCDIEQLYRSGMIDVSAFDADQYVLSRILVTAALYRAKDSFIFSDKNMKEVRNLIFV